MSMKLYKASLVTCAVAAALGLSACNRDNVSREGERNTTGTSGVASNAQRTYASVSDVTLSGCLQKNEGVLGDYILTQANSPAESVGTSGTLGTVERRDLQAAARSYRLSGQSDRLRDMIGHQVRVMGTLADRGDIAADAKSATPSNPPALKEGDLAKVDVTSVENISDVCASGQSRPAAPAK